MVADMNVYPSLPNPGSKGNRALWECIKDEYANVHSRGIAAHYRYNPRLRPQTGFKAMNLRLNEPYRTKKTNVIP